METKLDIRQLSLEELITQIADLGEKKFRAKQIYEWLWKKRATDFNQMTNLSKSLRETLKENFIINEILLKEAQKSKDKTIKNAFLLADNSVIEGVLIPTKKRMTACVSVQVGCSLDCAFCATGKLKKVRNLNADEIFDQVVMINEQSNKEFNIPLSNIVFMGMGEPLLNYKNVIELTLKLMQLAQQLNSTLWAYGIKGTFRSIINIGTILFFINIYIMTQLNPIFITIYIYYLLIL